MGKGVAALASALALTLTMSASAMAQLPTTSDPRVGLAPGLDNPGVAKSGMELLAHRDKPAGFFDPASPGSFAFPNSDMAFQGDYAFIGNFHGWQAWNIANPSAPTLRTAVVCPGGQGEVSVFGNLLFMAVEETRAKIDCTLTPASTAATRFRGVRVFDISNLDAPQQVAAVQTCRGAHTHTVVTDEDDPNNIYVYVQGTSGARPATELAGCSNAAPSPTNTNPSRWRIDVIKVPLAAPQNAAIVNGPRLFQEGDRVDGLQQQSPNGGVHPSGAFYSPTPTTDSCHDITVYPEIDLAAGACEGNGLLIDISDPANPQRIDAVADNNFAYWHGATFSNDGKTVVFTDEWGGGTTPRCRATDQLNWGADAIYDIVDGKLVFRSYYKLPVAQTNQENCVSHLPSLVPVPGRDIMVQAWYQGGASLVDFTDSSNPKEIGYWDRGPISGTAAVLGGFWSTYWYNGETFGSEIARGLDSFALTPTDQLSVNEIAAAREVLVDRFNPQHQDRITWQPSFAVTRSFRDQLERAGAIDAKTLAQVDKFVDRAERFRSGPQANAARAQLRALANQLEGEQFDALRESLIALADA
jgi:hypothetical protein